jgi:hypothetical protein
VGGVENETQQRKDKFSLLGASKILIGFFIILVLWWFERKKIRK